MTKIRTYDDWAQVIAERVKAGEVVLTEDLTSTHLYLPGFAGEKIGQVVEPARAMEVLNRDAPSNMARWN